MQTLAEDVIAAPAGSEARARVTELMRERFPEHLEHGAGSAAPD
jgi:hypothetical protein